MSVNFVVEKMYDKHPLARFSVYTSIQFDILDKIADEIGQVLEKGMAERGSVEGDSFNRAYGLFWLWTLGAYEAARTMVAASECFSPPAVHRIRQFKTKIEKLRMPFAKQEHRGKSVPIWGEASVSDVDHDRKDLGFDIDGDVFWMREILSDFQTLARSFSVADIHADHRSSSRYRKGEV